MKRASYPPGTPLLRPASVRSYPRGAWSSWCGGVVYELCKRAGDLAGSSLLHHPPSTFLPSHPFSSSTSFLHASFHSSLNPSDPPKAMFAPYPPSLPSPPPSRPSRSNVINLER
ncbi:hypothetical protein E2C01_024650 [Portunus trituberculatus]|uniref:Uncharacterized protein n=1 Tax=Portunus trituberculatus TaxID=210409 RepID=A0A5B7EEB9_PORTR|nr:hypothetical protein [Portunus trituberculatus]